MKSIVNGVLVGLVGSLLLSSNPLRAQENITYWKNTGQSVHHRDSADYFRVIKPPQPGRELPQLVEYYPNQQLKRKGNLLEPGNASKFQGPVIQYYENGRKKAEEFFDEGERVGKARYYYRSGQLKKEMKYGKRRPGAAFGQAEQVKDTFSVSTTAIPQRRWPPV